MELHKRNNVNTKCNMKEKPVQESIDKKVGSWSARLVGFLYSPQDPSSLGMLRICFGISFKSIIIIEMVKFEAFGMYFRSFDDSRYFP